MAPEVSVIIPTYNRAMAGEAVQSALAQTNADFELIVVDDGSTDPIWEQLACERLARTVAARCEFQMLRIEHRGPAAARNAGVAIARAPLIAFLDSDDLWAPGKLERQLAFMREHRELRISQCNEYWFREARRVNPGIRHRKRAGDFFVDSLRTCLISPSAVIMETALFREAGGFDEDLAAAEDYDLWLRILSRHRVGLLDETLVTRRGHRDQLSATIPAIDRFRLLALMKLLLGTDLTSSRRAAVCEVLAEKARIYANGLRRRGRDEQADFHESAARNAEARWKHATDDSLSRAVAELRTMLRAAPPEDCR